MRILQAILVDDQPGLWIAGAGIPGASITRSGGLAGPIRPNGRPFRPKLARIRASLVTDGGESR